MDYPEPYARTRYEGSFSTLQCVRENRYVSSDVLRASTTSSRDIGQRIVMEDVVVPYFKKRSAKGEVFCNPMTRTDEYRSLIPADGYLTDGNQYWDGPLFLSQVSPLSFDYADDLDRLKNLAVTQAFARLTSAEASILVTLGELKETKELLLSCFTRLGKLYKFCRTYKANLERIVKKLSWKYKDLKGSDLRNMAILELTDKWLEYRYAWRPFIAECKQLHEVFTKVRETPERQTARSKRFCYSDAADDKPYIANYYEAMSYTRKSSIQVFASAGVLGELRFMAWPDTFGLTKLPSALFDLTTLSFTVGWFFNVAEVIAAWTPDTNWRPRASWVTVETLLSQSVQLDSYEHFHGVTGNFGGQSEQYVTHIYQRIPHPHRTVIPQFRLNLDFAKILDGIALAKPLWQDLLSPELRRPRKR